MTPLNIPYVSGKEHIQIKKAIAQHNLSGDGFFNLKIQEMLAAYTKALRVLTVPSCTHALEMSAILLDIKPGDEVIMSSFNFVSAANAFVLRGARLIFVDIHPHTMNIDEAKIEEAISPRTKAIVVMHYGGISCRMEVIMALAKKHQLFVVEDAAQCIGAWHKNQHLGTIGHLGTFSFHSTKNIHCGEGGVLLINDHKLVERAEIIREKGTNRKKFLNGVVDKYSWVDIGSSYLMSELNAAFLSEQINQIKEVTDKRRAIYDVYQKNLKTLSAQLQFVLLDHYNKINAHTFFIKCKNKEERTVLIQFLKQHKIKATFHYIPLHNSLAGTQWGSFSGKDIFTTKESEKLLRLPLYYDLSLDEAARICEVIIRFYEKENF